MAQAGGPGRRSQGRPRPKGPPRADGPTSKPKALPARPGGPKYRKSATGIEVATRGRPTMVRLGELVLLAGCLAFLYIPVSHYLKTGKWPNLLSSRGWSVIETGVAEGRENLKESYGYIKDRLPQTTGELRAWLEDRGQKLASTEELLAMASKAAEAMELEATPDAGAGGVSTEVSDAKREEFRRRQEARAERLAQAAVAREAEALKRAEARMNDATETVEADPPRDGDGEETSAGPDPAPIEEPSPPEARPRPVAAQPEVMVASAGPVREPAVVRPVTPKGPEREPERKPVPRTPAPRVSGKNTDLAKGRAFYLEAMSHFRNTAPTNPKWQDELQVSRGLFRKAQQHLERACNNDPSNVGIEELLTRTNMFLYDCMKRSTLKGIR